MAAPPIPTPHRTMTLAEWGDLPEDGAGELADGRLIEEEEVGILHDLVVAWLIQVLRSWVAPRGGLVGASDTRFAVSESTGRKPDVWVYYPGRRPPAHGLVAVPPDIMIEVVSPRPSDARRDRLDKKDDYAAFGVRYYWIVDPNSRTIEIFELGADGRYIHARGAAEGVVTDVPGCEGLILDIGGLWSEADRLETTD